MSDDQDEDGLTREDETVVPPDEPRPDEDEIITNAVTKMHLAVVRGRSTNGKRATVWEQQQSAKWLDDQIKAKPPAAPVATQSLDEIKKALLEQLRAELLQNPETHALIARKVEAPQAKPAVVPVEVGPTVSPQRSRHREERRADEIRRWRYR
jgi:hypothetical protein